MEDCSTVGCEFVETATDCFTAQELLPGFLTDKNGGTKRPASELTMEDMGPSKKGCFWDNADRYFKFNPFGNGNTPSGNAEIVCDCRTATKWKNMQAWESMQES